MAIKCTTCQKTLVEGTGVGRGKDKMCHPCAARANGTEISPAELRAEFLSWLKRLPPQAAARVRKHVRDGKAILCGDRYAVLKVVHRGVPALPVVAAGTRVKKNEDRDFPTDQETRMLDRMNTMSDGSIGLYGYAIRQISVAAMKKALPKTRKTAKPLFNPFA